MKELTYQVSSHTHGANQGVPYVGAVAEIPSGVPWLAEQLLRTPWLIAAGCQQECQTCAWLVHSKSAHQDRSKSNIKVRPHVASILAMSTSCTCPSTRSVVVVLAAASLSIFNSPISLTRLATTTHHKLHHEFGTHAMDMCELVATT